MHCMLSDDCKESNIAKGVNTAIEFKEYEDTYSTKKQQKQNEKNSK